MNELLYILAATGLVSLVGFAGALFLFVRREILDKIVFVLVAFSAGALLSGAFFHLLVEALDTLEPTIAFIWLFAAFILFFIIERFLHWHHCHSGNCEVHAFSYLILFGDGVHNFIDGLVIAASFLVDSGFGIVTTMLIIGHEVPQEIGNFGALVYGGFGRGKALLFCFISQLTAILGGIIGFLFASSQGSTAFLLPFAAGGFIYIAASDLIPELHKEKDFGRLMVSFLFFIIGIVFMFLMKVVFG